MKLINETRGTVLASHLMLATTDAELIRGLTGRVGLMSGEGLWLTRCNSITTEPITFPIDILFLDSTGCVVAYSKDTPPDFYFACPAAVSAVELPPGVLASSGTVIGDRICYVATGKLDEL